VALVTHVVRVTSDGASYGGMDNAIVLRAGRAWLAGGSPYGDPHFLYPPGAVLAGAAEAALPGAVVRGLVPVVAAGCLVAGWACALRLCRVPWRSRAAVAGLTGPAAGFAPFGHVLLLGNWTVLSAAALPAALLCAARGRWVRAGAVLGLALALKPLLAPAALLFLFARRWRGLAVLLAVPVVVSVLAGLLLPDPAGFFTRTLPFLLTGGDSFVRLYEASLGAVLERLGAPGAVARGVAGVCAGAGVWCAWRRWRGGAGWIAGGAGWFTGGTGWFIGRTGWFIGGAESSADDRCRSGTGLSEDDDPLRFAETGALLMLSAFLVSRPSYDHYLLMPVLLLLAGLPYRGAVARSPWFWLALVPQLPGLVWPGLEPETRRAFKDAVTLCGLAVTAGVSAVRRPGAAREEGVRVMGSSPPPPLPFPDPGAPPQGRSASEARH
jgi:arabinofuranan 3-O-arabinosyltransferase